MAPAARLTGMLPTLHWAGAIAIRLEAIASGLGAIANRNKKRTGRTQHSYPARSDGAGSPEGTEPCFIPSSIFRAHCSRNHVVR